MKPIKFKVRLGGAGKYGNVAYFSPPFDVPQTFGKRGRVPIKGTINGFPFRSSLCQMGGPHFMCVNKQLCGVGDTVRVILERDEEKRAVRVPPFLKKIISGDKAAKANWDKHSYTHQKEYVQWVTEAKHEETRERRISKMMQMLKNGERRK